MKKRNEYSSFYMALSIRPFNPCPSFHHNHRIPSVSFPRPIIPISLTTAFHSYNLFVIYPGDLVLLFFLVISFSIQRENFDIPHQVSSL